MRLAATRVSALAVFFWAFQIPLIMASRHFRGHRRGNVLVWMSLFCGQPLLEILYFRLWFQQHDTFFCVP